MRGQGRIYKRGTVYWIAYYHRGAEIRESAHSERESDAKRLLRERLRTAGTPNFIGPDAERLTFDDLAATYLTDYRVNDRRSLRDAQRAVRWLGRSFGSERALDITTDRIGAYAEARLRDGAARATINRELSALRRMLRLAVRTRKLVAAPYVPLLAGENVREGFLEPAEFDAVAAHLPDDLADAARFAYLSGWRKSEVRTLEWSDIDRNGGVIRLRIEHSKTKKPRVLVLRGELFDLVHRRAATRRLDCPYVFHRDGKHIGDFRKAWASACSAAGVPGRLFHDLRRSAVRNMIRAGVPERVAMDVSGHRTRSVFDRYNIVSEDDLGDAAERTAGYVSRQREKAPRVVPLRPR